MGKLDPSQQDRWWKSRIEKEELQYSLKQDQQDAVKPTTKEVTFLNTLGLPQVRRTPVEPPQIDSPMGSAVRPATAAPSASGPSPEDDVKSLASVAKSSAVKAGSVASLARSAKPSQAVTDSPSAIAKRLDMLEEALSAERVKRLQAEEEMRQLMTMKQQQKGAK